MAKFKVGDVITSNLWGARDYLKVTKVKDDYYWLENCEVNGQPLYNHASQPFFTGSHYAFDMGYTLVREFTREYDTETNTCAYSNHDFKEYVGFTESYKYCTKCDTKGQL